MCVHGDLAAFRDLDRVECEEPLLPREHLPHHQGGLLAHHFLDGRGRNGAHLDQHSPQPLLLAGLVLERECTGQRRLVDQALADQDVPECFPRRVRGGVDDVPFAQDALEGADAVDHLFVDGEAGVGRIAARVQLVAVAGAAGAKRGDEIAADLIQVVGRNTGTDLLL